ncbi:DUF3463 domain-containing protein [Paraburkholderia dipogonis]|uniref:DUF3463 domain-containing protein n=1 Tax=Paraburkholderia dipogonis TaxID=1211383 RepID=UPI0035E6838D
MFLDFLAGNQTYECTPWGQPRALPYSAGKKPCYLVGEGYVKTFKELMENHAVGKKYGTGNYEKCADCMVHCGFRSDRRDGYGHASAEGAEGQPAPVRRTSGAFYEGHSFG